MEGSAQSQAQVATQVTGFRPTDVRVYVDPLWIPDPQAVMERYILSVPLARAYGCDKAMLLNGTTVSTQELSANTSMFLTDIERVLARHRCFAAIISIRHGRESASSTNTPSTSEPSPAPNQSVLAIHAPTWDWDCLSGDVNLFIQNAGSARGRTLLHRYGTECMVAPYAVIDEQALEADASECVALALEAASCEAVRLGKRAHVKLPVLGAATHLRTPHGIVVGPHAYRAFWKGVKLALQRCAFPGIAILECCDKFGAGGLGACGGLGGLTVTVPSPARDITDFSGTDPSLLPCIVVPGSSFQMAGGLASFQLTLESGLAANSDMNLVFSPLFNSALLACAKNAVAAEQPAVVRPHWWPPAAVRRYLSLH